MPRETSLVSVVAAENHCPELTVASCAGKLILVLRCRSENLPVVDKHVPEKARVGHNHNTAFWPPGEPLQEMDRTFCTVLLHSDGSPNGGRCVCVCVWGRGGGVSESCITEVHGGP